MNWLAQIIKGILGALLPFLARENPTKGTTADRSSRSKREWIRNFLLKHKRGSGSNGR
jgi:hypothetical protein